MMRTPTTDATAAIVARFAMTGRDDPTIAARLEITVSEVRALRREYDIPPGETRWLSHRNPLNTRYAGEEAPA